ncbi:MAG: hypothetical protein EOM20_11235 [Spartobacteria bacterium]|nr:hypothetical protein [Spartobacteria bacterium]
MLNTTKNAIKEILKADPSLSPTERTRTLARMRELEPKTTAQASTPEILRRADVARMLHRSLRAVDMLAAEGFLTRVTLPGRKRSCGFRKAEVYSLIGEAS